MMIIKLSVITAASEFLCETIFEVLGKNSKILFKLKTILKLQSSKQNNLAYRITNVYIKPDIEKF